eukprot:PITA_01503
MEHLLNNYIFTSRLWDSFASIFQQSDRDIGSLFNTLTNWRKNFSDNEVLSATWALTPSFIIRNVWKERNNRIFKNAKKSPQYLYGLIMKQIKETGLVRKATILDLELDFWHPRPKGFLKLNIDGASKGNPGTADHGGVLRDNNGRIMFIFHGHLGKATNNMVELMAMEHCLEFLVQENYQNMIIEADSKLIINSVKRISWGMKPEKASRNWRLVQVFQWIHSHLQSLRTVSFAHVRRKANKMVDLLANQGVIYTDNRVAMNWKELPQNKFKTACQNLADEDKTVFQHIRERAMEAATVDQ